MTPASAEEPTKPSLKIVEVNLIGVLYTVKLALHYFKKQADVLQRDRCLILLSSMAGYIDAPGTPQYQASKFGVRGLMRGFRQKLWQDGVRVNVVAPWYKRQFLQCRFLNL